MLVQKQFNFGIITEQKFEFWMVEFYLFFEIFYQK